MILYIVFSLAWSKKIIYYILLAIKSYTLRRRLIKKILFYCIAVIYDIICNISEILYIIYYLKKSKSRHKIYNI